MYFLLTATGLQMLTSEQMEKSLQFQHIEERSIFGKLKQSISIDNISRAIKGLIDTSKDLKGGRKKTDHQAAKNKSDHKSLKTIAYFPDGEYIIGGGDSKNMCLYDVRHRTMIKRIEVITSTTVEGTNPILTSRRVKDGINLDILEEEIETKDAEARKKGAINFMDRRNDGVAQIRQICLDPTGRLCAVVHTNGVSVYMLASFFSKKMSDSQFSYSKQEIINMAERKDYFSLAVAALTIDDYRLAKMVLEKVGAKEAELLIQMIPSSLVEKLLDFLSKYIEETTFIESASNWLKLAILYHSDYMDTLNSKAVLKKTKQNLTRRMEFLKKE